MMPGMRAYPWHGRQTASYQINDELSPIFGDVNMIGQEELTYGNNHHSPTSSELGRNVIPYLDRLGD